MLLLWLATTGAQTPVNPLWVTRGDSAAAALSAAATSLSTMAAEVAARGRAGRFPELHAQSEQLVSRAVALRRAVDAAP